MRSLPPSVASPKSRNISIGLFLSKLGSSVKCLRNAGERGPLLRLRFPGTACGTRQEALRQSGEPLWTSQKLRECWDVNGTCLSMSKGGIFDSCEEGFVEMNGLEIRTITLADPKGDVQVRRTATGNPGRGPCRSLEQ